MIRELLELLEEFRAQIFSILSPYPIVQHFYCTKMDSVFFLFMGLYLVTKFGDIDSIDCPEIYLRYSADHSYCKPPNPTCDIMRSYLTQEEMDQILELHNSFRSVVATRQEESRGLPPAANMLQMEWDNELAAVAQRYADQCIYAHDCPNCRRVRNFGTGQNLAIQRLTGHNLTPPSPDWPFAISAWFEEIVFFSKNLVCPFQPPNGEEFRHFSQLIWAKTFRVGCGYTMYRTGNTIARLYVCNYGPSGNVYKTCTYTEGPACSKCPENTCCGDRCPSPGPSYPGLCKRINDEAPFTPVTQPTLFDCNFQNPSKEDCLINSMGDGDWYIVPVLEGNFLETVLTSNQNGTIIFSKRIKPSGTKKLCVQIRYRKGPTIDGNPDNNNANEVFVIPSMNGYSFTQQLKSYDSTSRQQFSTFNLTLNWDQETEMKVSFAVPRGATPQFFNVDSILAVDGKCEK